MLANSIAVASSAAAPGLAAVARSQLPDARIEADAIGLHGDEPAALLRTAMQLRRWSSAVSPAPTTPPASFAVAEAGSAREALTAAQRLAAEAPPGAVVAQAALPGDEEWIAGSPVGAGTVELHWARGDDGRPIKLLLPGPVQGALDRPWGTARPRGGARSARPSVGPGLPGSGSLTLLAGELGSGSRDWPPKPPARSTARGASSCTDPVRSRAAHPSRLSPRRSATPFGMRSPASPSGSGPPPWGG